MSKKKNKDLNNPVDKRAVKKAAVLGREKKGHTPLIYIGTLVVLLVAGVIFFATQKGKDTRPAAGPMATQSSATQVTFPVGDFVDGKARHFQHVFDDGITVKYFVLRSSDGVIRAAFDACDVCWPAGKGYYQNGDVMVCRNCGRQFVSVLVNEVKGGCNPAPLNRKVEEDEVVIQVADLLGGKQYFDFSKRS
jgi:uncharacterized membrane protein